MRFKMKMAIFFASVLLALLGFNSIATLVYGDTVRGVNRAELEMLTSSMAQVGKEFPYHVVQNKNRGDCIF